MIPLGPVVARSRVKASRIDTWSYLVEADLRSEWWPELRLEPEVGGSVAEQWSEGEGDESVSRDASGTIDVWVEGHAIGFTWREAGDERDTAVLLTLRTQSGGTGITITETGFDALPKPAERAEASQEGWKVLLNDLSAAIDAAVDAGALAAAAVVGGGAVAAGVAGAAGAAAVEGPADAETADGETTDELAEDAESAGESEGAGAEEAGADAADADADAPAAPVGGELDTVPVVLDGEVVESASDDDDEIVLDPEPQLGDHLELDTGSISIVSDDDAGDSSNGDAADQGPEAETVAEEPLAQDAAAGDDSADNAHPAETESSVASPAEEGSADEEADADMPDDQPPTPEVPAGAEVEAADTAQLEEADAAEDDPAEVAADTAGTDTDEAEADIAEAPERAEGADESEDDEDEPQTTGDPDFDDLIRGLI